MKNALDDLLNSAKAKKMLKKEQDKNRAAILKSIENNPEALAMLLEDSEAKVVEKLISTFKKLTGLPVHNFNVYGKVIDNISNLTRAINFQKGAERDKLKAIEGLEEFELFKSQDALDLVAALGNNTYLPKKPDENGVIAIVEAVLPNETAANYKLMVVTQALGFEGVYQVDVSKFDIAEARAKKSVAKLQLAE